MESGPRTMRHGERIALASSRANSPCVVRVALPAWQRPSLFLCPRSATASHVVRSRVSWLFSVHEQSASLATLRRSASIRFTVTSPETVQRGRLFAAVTYRGLLFFEDRDHCLFIAIYELRRVEGRGLGIKNLPRRASASPLATARPECRRSNLVSRSSYG